MFTVSSLLNVTGQTALVACDVLDLHTPCFCHTVAALGSFQPWQTAEKQGEVRVSEAQTALLKELEEWKERCSRLLGRAWLEHLKRDDVYQKTSQIPQSLSRHLPAVCLVVSVLQKTGL